MEKILSGIRVLDITDAVAGPYCTRYLSDCGCEVITIERPGGKSVRSHPPHFDGQSLEYLYNHCGKKSLGIDLKQDGARDLVGRLAKISDVVIENFRPGVMNDLGLGYPFFKEINASIIMCSISGWGQAGPYAEFMGADMSMQAHSGILSLTGEKDGAPCLVGFPVTDILAGLNAFGAICAALYHRAITGKGEFIDIAMRDCAIATLHQAIGVHVLGIGDGRNHRYSVGRFNPFLSPLGIFKGRDGYIALSAQTDIGWNRLTELMGKPELASDPRFNSREKRVENHKEVTELIEDWVQLFDRIEDVAALLQSVRIQAAPVLSLPQIIEEDPQFRIRGMLREIEHESLGKVTFLNTPLRFKYAKAEVEEPPPARAGEHTDYVLRSILKLNDDEILDYRKRGIVFP